MKTPLTTYANDFFIPAVSRYLTLHKTIHIQKRKKNIANVIKNLVCYMGKQGKVPSQVDLWSCNLGNEDHVGI